MARRIMKKFRITEISAVDRPAQAHVLVAIFKRDSASNQQETNMSRTEELQSLAKDGGVFKVAKCIVDDGRAFSISERELTGMITEVAKRDRRDNETVEVAFSRILCAKTDEALLLRKALAIAKNFPQMMSVEPTQTSSPSTMEGDALEQLKRLAAEQKKRSPWLSIEQAFSAVYQDAKNSELVAAERKQAYERMRAQRDVHV